MRNRYPSGSGGKKERKKSKWEKKQDSEADSKK